MFYVGIDVAKKNHEASIINSKGELLDKSISFSNSQTGCTKLLSLFDKFEADSSNIIIGMEATGHYWHQVILSGSVFPYLFISCISFNLVSSTFLFKVSVLTS